LGWVLSNEDFLSASQTIDFLKLRATYGKVGNVNESYRFLYQQWATTAGGWRTGSNNTERGGRREGAIANPNASWEEKTSLNVGIDLKIFKKLTATIDLFNEKRTGILELPNADIPGYTGFALQRLRSEE